jgi:agmatinase
MLDYTLFGKDSRTYANIFTFMGYPLSRELDKQVDAIVMGVPYDLATSGRSGTRFGPTGIRQASAQLRWEEKRWPYRFILADKLRVIDYGDLHIDVGKHEQMLDTVTKEASHTDDAKDVEGHFHGSMFYHAPKEGLMDPDKTVQIGIRTEHQYDNNPFTVLDAAWANSHSVEDIVGRIRETVGDTPTYLSLDIDCLDPAFAPGTGTPVAGGLTTDKTLQILRGLKGLNIVAMDLMEVSPAYDHAEITSLAAATLALELLHMVAASR